MNTTAMRAAAKNSRMIVLPGLNKGRIRGRAAVAIDFDQSHLEWARHAEMACKQCSAAWNVRRLCLFCNQL